MNAGDYAVVDLQTGNVAVGCVAATKEDAKEMCRRDRLCGGRSVVVRMWQDGRRIIPADGAELLDYLTRTV
jgi:hypothetical protein